ncbi:hypothetical protein AAON49_09650 [Pseudotenacibaculum sp. MALMAid0570]|uniref:hypothetical protein n=1 Tax=Pseudotenacibaculum sp. MALMAid0570 TaxID=3143938 RepID=UPI0032E02551
MKTLTSFFFLGMLFLTTCLDTNVSYDETINGTWNLRNVSGGLQGINIDYNHGLVKWTFDLQNNLLTVENNITTTGPQDIYAGLDSGTYNFEIEENNQLQTLYVNGVKQGDVYIDGFILKLDDGIAADGFLKEFER